MNPTQKSGNPRPRRYKKRMSKRDYRTKRIARTEAKKVLATKVESKTYEYNNIAFDISSTAGTSIFDLTNGLTRGTGESNFIGDSILPTHVRIRYVLEGVDSYNVVRVVVIQQKAGGIPTGATVFEYSGSLNAPLSPYDADYGSTYRVLYDEFFVLTLGTDTQYLSGDIRIPSKKLHKMTFDTGATLTSGGIYLIFISDSVAAPNPDGRLVSRVYFKDA